MSAALRADGRPLIASTQQLGGANNLVLYGCDDPSCFDGAARRLQNSGFPGAAAILVRPDERPLLIYTRAGTLIAFDCVDEDCSTGVENTLVDVAIPDRSIWTLDSPEVLLGIDGRPIIVYTASDFSLDLVRCNDPNCQSANHRSLTSPTIEGVPHDHRAAIRSDGRLLVSYFEPDEAGTSVVRYLYDCDDTGCTSGSAHVATLAALPNDRFTPVSLAVPAGQNPLLSYVTEARSLIVFDCDDATCSSGLSRTIARNVADISVSRMVLGLNDRPAIAYRSNGRLNLFRCDFPRCARGFNGIGIEQVIVENVDFIPTPPTLNFRPDGSAVIHYQTQASDELSQDELRIAICDSASCAGPTSSTLLPQGHAVGGFNSLAIGSDGRAAVSYRDETADDLKIYVCDDLECKRGFGRRLDGAFGTNAGTFSSIAFRHDGRPIVSYATFNPPALGVYDCADANCQSGTAYLAGVGGDVEYTSIAVRQDGRPIVSFYQEELNRLAIYDCFDANCTTGTMHRADDVVGRFTSIAIRQNGRPIISFASERTSLESRLEVYDCLDTACSDGVTRVLDDSAAIVGKHTSIAIRPNGLPFISYTDQSKLVIKGYDCHDSDCSSGVIRQISTDIESLGGSSNRLNERTTSVAISTDGRPIVSYFSYGDDFRVFECVDTQCSDGKPLVLGKSGDDVGRYSSLAVRPDGRRLLSYDSKSQRLILFGDLPPLMFEDGFE